METNQQRSGVTQTKHPSHTTKNNRLSDILSNLGDTYVAHEGELVEELSHVELNDLFEVGLKKYAKRLLKYIVRNPLLKKNKSKEKVKKPTGE